MSKTSITLSVDADVKEKAMDIVQNKLNDSLSNYTNERYKELVKKYSTSKCKKEVTSANN